MHVKNPFNCLIKFIAKKKKSKNAFINLISNES